MKPIALASALVTIVMTSPCSKTQGGQQSNLSRGDQQRNLSRYWSQAGPEARNAQKNVKSILEEAAEKKQLTDEQITTLSGYVDSPNNVVRLEAIAALRDAGSQHTQAAIAVARKGLKSMDSMTRLYTLTTLDKLDAPDIVSIAKRMSNDRSQYVRPEAERILKKRGA